MRQAEQKQADTLMSVVFTVEKLRIVKGTERKKRLELCVAQINKVIILWSHVGMGLRSCVFFF